jgi:hypothetical protein
MTYPINGPGQWARHGDYNDDNLPRREPTPLAEAETGQIYTGTDGRYDDAAQAFRDRWAEAGNRPAEVLYEMPETNVTMLEGPNTPPWNGFDTFLRRALMIGGNIVVWAAIVMSVLLALGSGYLLSKVGSDGAAVTPPSYEQPSADCNPDNLEGC